MPLTVKIRLGESSSRVNVDEVVALLGEAGAAAVTVHGRTMEQRYKRPADWGAVQRVASQTAAAGGVPVIGNGDVLTHYEARRRMDSHSCLAVMVGRCVWGGWVCMGEVERCGVFVWRGGSIWGGVLEPALTT